MIRPRPAGRVPRPSGRWVLIALLTLAGCTPTAPPVTTNQNSNASATAPGTPTAPSSPPTALPATTTISEGEGDRLKDVKIPVRRTTAPQESSPFRFAEVAGASGITFEHFSGMTDDRHFPTANGSGVAFLDFDGDGKLDLYFATATRLPLGTYQAGPNRLYRNLGNGQFADATESSGLGYVGFCHGIVVGDVDNDGDPDVFLCNYGSNVLYRNNGNGTFADVSREARVDRPGWSSGGAFLDMDDDGDLDLYVCNYGEWRLPDNDDYCGNRERHVRFYCSPRSVKTTKHFFYRNNGDGTFADVADQFLVDANGATLPSRSDGHGFAAVAADLDGNGKVDLYVANDMNPNFLFLNRGGGRFEDATETSGAAYDVNGQAQSGMGVDGEDVNGDGFPDLYVTNFAFEYNTLYLNLTGRASFQDTTSIIGLAVDTMPYVGWGAALADFNNDGWPDCFTANGHVDNNRSSGAYAEPPLLHLNVPGPASKTRAKSTSNRRFRLATRDVGPYFATDHVARGAAFGDFDDDGDLDIAVNHKDAPAALLRNDTPAGANRWLRLQLVGTRSNRDAVGAAIRVEFADDRPTIVRQRKGGCSVFSGHDPRVLIGVGPAAEVAKLTIRWPSGTVTTREHVATNQTLRLVEGE